MKAFEEVSEAFEEFEEGVTARAHSISGLRSFESNIKSILPAKKDGTHCEEKIDSGEDETCWLERNLVGKD